MTWVVSAISVLICVGCAVAAWRQHAMMTRYRSAAAGSSADPSRKEPNAEVRTIEQLAGEAKDALSYRYRVLAANELVGLAKMHREKAKRLASGLSKISLFTGGAAALFALSAELSGGEGLVPAFTALGFGVLGAGASAAWGRSARRETQRFIDAVRAVADQVGTSGSGDETRQGDDG